MNILTVLLLLTLLMPLACDRPRPVTSPVNRGKTASAPPPAREAVLHVAWEPASTRTLASEAGLTAGVIGGELGSEPEVGRLLHETAEALGTELVPLALEGSGVESDSALRELSVIDFGVAEASSESDIAITMPGLENVDARDFAR